MSLPSQSKLRSFYKRLQALPDTRDRRGLRHDQAFILMGVTLALLHGYTTVQAMHAFCRDCLNWLRRLTRHPGPSISRSY